MPDIQMLQRHKKILKWQAVQQSRRQGGGGGELQVLYFPSVLSFLLVIVQAAGMNFVGLFGREQEPVSPLRPCACPHLLGLPVTCTDH